MGYTILNPGLPLGNVVATSAIVGLHLDISALLTRHKHGDWGDLTLEEKSHNDSGSKHGFPITSRYVVATPGGHPVVICVETNGDRTETLICLLSEYYP